MELLLFDIFTLLLIKLDMYNYENQITPLTIIALTYAALININNLVVSKIYNFYSVNNTTILVICLFFFWIFMVDIMFGCLYRRTYRVAYKYTMRFKSYKGVTFLFVVGVAAYSIQFLRLYALYGLNIKGMNNGILGHLSSLAFILGPVSLDLAIKKRNRVKIFISIIMNVAVLAISVLFGGKYVIFINLTYFLLYFILKRDSKVDIQKLTKIAIPLIIAAIGVFVIIYYIIPRMTGRYQATMNFAIQHMFEYLLGPIIANNYTITHPTEGNILIPFTVFINIGKALARTGNYVSSIYAFLFPIRGTYTTNVSGFLGETIYNLGLMGAMLYVTAIFVIINLFYYMYRSRNKFYLSFCYCSAVLVYLFFCNFFTVSGVVLPFLLALFIDAFSMYKVGSYHI